MDDREFYLPPEEPVLPEEFSFGRETLRIGTEFPGAVHRDEYNEKSDGAEEQKTESRMHKLLKRQMLAPLAATITTVAVVLSSYGVDPLGKDFLAGSGKSSSSDLVSAPARILKDVGTWETADGKNVVHFDPDGNGWWFDGHYYGIMSWEETSSGSVEYGGYASYIREDQREGKTYPGNATILHPRELYLYRESGGYELEIDSPLAHHTAYYRPASRREETPSYVRNAYGGDMKRALAGLSFTWASSQSRFRPQDGDYCMESLSFDGSGCSGVYSQFINGEKTSPQSFRATMTQNDDMQYPCFVTLEASNETEHWYITEDGRPMSYQCPAIFGVRVMFTAEGVMLAGMEPRNDPEDRSGDWYMEPAGTSALAPTVTEAVAAVPAGPEPMPVLREAETLIPPPGADYNAELLDKLERFQTRHTGEYLYELFALADGGTPAIAAFDQQSDTGYILWRSIVETCPKPGYDSFCPQSGWVLEQYYDETTTTWTYSFHHLFVNDQGHDSVYDYTLRKTYVDSNGDGILTEEEKASPKYYSQSKELTKAEFDERFIEGCDVKLAGRYTYDELKAILTGTAIPTPASAGLTHYAEETGEISFPTLTNLEPNGYINDYFGVLNEQYIRLQSETEDLFLVAGSAYPGKTVTVPGISYDGSTNILTLTNFSGPILNVNLMGNGFTIKLVGENELDGILVWGFNYGGSLTFTGSGSLTVNKTMTLPVGLDLRGESSDTCLMVDKDVTLDVYGSDQAVYITGTWMEKNIYYLRPNQLYGGVRQGVKDLSGECFGGIYDGPDSSSDATHIRFSPK